MSDTSVAAGAAQLAVTAQAAAERAAEECRTIASQIRDYEARRPVVQRLTEVVTSDGVDLSAKVGELEAAILAIKDRPTALVPVAPISVPADTRRIDEIERMVLDTRDRLARIGTPGSGEVVPGLVSDLLDRMAALEELVIESMQSPKALADQLRLTADVMQAMEDRARAMREADQAMIEMHRTASEQTALAQGGLAAVVESMRVDIDGLAGAVAHLKSQLAKRDGYTAQFIKRSGTR